MQKLVPLSLARWKCRLLPLCLLLTALSAAYPTFAQTTIKGKVSDESGMGMPGVNIIQKGTTNGTTTDADGAYTISLTGTENGVLIFSFIGYTSQEVPTNSRTVLDIKLVPSTETLSEVVVVGYGTQLKRDITGAIVSVSGETLMETAAPNVIAQLKGHAAGVDIVSNSAVPGGGGQIRIRGNRTMVAATTTATNDAAASDQIDQPLIVVDGIPFGGNINDISPNDIASLEILKDASATAIYGSRGAGGVILITTKRGKTGKPVISYDAYYGTSTIMDKLKVFTGPEYAAFKTEAAAGAAPAVSGYLLTTAEQTALDAGVSTDWQDLIYRTGSITNHSLAVNGGTENTRYSMSGGYFKEKGVIPNQDFSRYSIRATIDNQIGKRIRLGINTMNMLSYQNTPGGSGVPVGMMRLTPLASPYNADGTINMLPMVGQTDGAFVSPLTLLSNSAAILQRSRKLRTFNSLYGEVDILKGLKYRINVGLDFSQQQDDQYSGVNTYVNTSTNPLQSTASVRNFEFWQYTVENLLMYETTIHQKHKIGFTGLYSIQKSHNQNSGMFGVGLPADYVQNRNLYLANTLSAVNPTNVNDNPNSFSERGLISYMARATYSFDNRASLTATIRTDGSSILSPGNQYFTYPAFAAAWNISNEGFMQNVSLVSNLKLRAGWGTTASQGLNPYSTLGGLSTSAYNFGLGAAGQQPGYTVTSLPNHSLKWQSTQQTNLGIDFGILKNRISGSIEVYSQKTENILLPVTLPPSIGASTTVQNIGSSKGHGLEVSISTVNIKSPSGLVWTTDLNYFFNREEIVSLTNPNDKMNIGNGWFVGQPLSVIYDYKKVGIWQAGDPDLSSQTSPVQKAGQIHVADLNGPAHDGKPDGKITADDRTIIGNFQPKYDMGMTNRFTFKRFDFSFTIYARIGMKMVVPYVSSDPNGSNNGYSFFMQSRNNQLKVNYWTPTNPTNEFPRPDASIGAPLYSSTLAYMDGSFVKMRTINLGYDIPTPLLSKAGIQSLHVYVSAVNPFIIYSPFVKGGFGPDPEGNGYGGSVNTQGNANNPSAPGRQISVSANNPSTRQFIFGLNLKF